MKGKDTLTKQALSKGFTTQDSVLKAKKFKKKYNLKSPVLEIMLLKGLIKPEHFLNLNPIRETLTSPEPGVEVETLIEVGELSPKKFKSCQNLYKRFPLRTPLYEVLFLRGAISKDMYQDISLAIGDSIDETPETPSSYQKTLFQDFPLKKDKEDDDETLKEIEELLSEIESDSPEENIPSEKEKKGKKGKKAKIEKKEKEKEKEDIPALTGISKFKGDELKDLLKFDSQSTKKSEEEMDLLEEENAESEEEFDYDWDEDMTDWEERSKFPLWIPISISMLLILGGGVGWWFLYRSPFASSSPEIQAGVFLQKAEQLEKEKAYPHQIIPLYSSAQNVAPNWGKVYIQRGCYHARNQQHTEAIHYLTKGINLSPGDTRGLYYLYKVLSLENKTEEADKTLHTLALIIPQDCYVQWAQGEIYLIDANKTMELEKRNEFLTEAIQTYKKTLENQEFKLSSLLRLAETHEKLYQHKMAFQYYKTILDIDPSLSDIRLKRAKEYLRQGEIDKFNEDIETVLLNNPKEPEAYILKYSFHKLQGNNKKATEDLKDAVLYLKDPIQKTFWEGNLAILEKDLEKAQQQFYKVINSDKDKTYVEARFILGELLEKVDIKEANTQFDLAIQEEPYNPLTYLKRAQFYFRSGRIEKAQEDLDKAKKRGPQEEEIHILQACIYRSQQEYILASNEIERANELAPGNPETYRLKFEMLDPQKGYSVNLEEDLNRWVNLQPYVSAPYMCRGEYYRYRRDGTKSLDNYNKVIELGDARGTLGKAAVLFIFYGKYQEAKEILETLRRTDPSFERDIQRMLEYFEKVLDAKKIRKQPRSGDEPKNLDAQLSNGFNLYQDGKYQEALNIVNEIIQSLDGDQTGKRNDIVYKAYNIAGASLGKMNMYQEAAKKFEEGIEKVGKEQGCLLAYNAALCYASIKDGKMAYRFLKEAANRGFSKPDLIQNNNILKEILSPEEEKEIIEIISKNKEKY